MHSKSDNAEFTTYDNANDVVGELFESLLSRYQIVSETSVRKSDFMFDFIQLLYYKYYKISFKRGGSYIDSPDWIKHKKAIINPKSKNDKCFQYAGTVSLNYREIKWNPEKNSNIGLRLNIICAQI